MNINIIGLLSAVNSLIQDSEKMLVACDISEHELPPPLDLIGAEDIKVVSVVATKSRSSHQLSQHSSRHMNAETVGDAQMGREQDHLTQFMHSLCWQTPHMEPDAGQQTQLRKYLPVDLLQVKDQRLILRSSWSLIMCFCAYTFRFPNEPGLAETQYKRSICVSDYAT
jgi:hypothetical protein